MTAFTATGKVLVNRSQKRSRLKTIGRIMACTALTLCRNMINALAGGDTGIMAYSTVIVIYAQMVKSYTCKAGEVSHCMTGRAIECGR